MDTCKVDSTALSDDDTRFLEDCRFAKVVKAGSGEALLIGGLVINVYGPEPAPFGLKSGMSYAALLAKALCMIDVRQFGLMPDATRLPDTGPLSGVDLLEFQLRKQTS